MSVGFRINSQFDRVTSEMVKQFKDLPVANVSDAMSRLYAGGSKLRPMHREGNLAGPAFTVKTRPGDNLMIHKAIEMAEPGDIIVVDASGDTTNSLMGELMLERAIKRGVAGFILHGAIRDLGAIYERNLPLFAIGVTHRGPYRTGPGEIGYPISIDGMNIEPGDLVLGDLDGVISVSKTELEETLSKAKAKYAAEQKQMEETVNNTIDRSWINKELRRLGCEFN